MNENTAVATTPRATLPEKIEQALVAGDLSGLSAAERVQFYNATCESMGLNPMTKPFGYILLQGKLTLYALKACTDQLRQIHGISIGQLREQEKDGLYIVFAPASAPDGRTDEDMGAVPLGGLKGDNLANAKLKAVTKAKRRVTLSICGLGWLDETEVETIKGATTGEPTPMRRPQPVSQFMQVAAVPQEPHPQDCPCVTCDEARDKKWKAEGVLAREPGADEALDAMRPPTASSVPGCITQKQFELLMVTARKGRGEEALRDKLGRDLGLEHVHELPADKFDVVLAWAGQMPVTPR